MLNAKSSFRLTPCEFWYNSTKTPPRATISKVVNQYIQLLAQSGTP